MSLVICEKPSQAKQIIAAVGNRYGRVISLRGHVIRLAEPHEVNPAWEKWNTDLLWTGEMFPFMMARHKDKKYENDLHQIVNTIKAALRDEDHVIIATDPDREGQLLGQEVLEFLNYRGRVSRVHFLAVDKGTISKAFQDMRPNEQFIGDYESGLARVQCDQIANLTLTRVCSEALRSESSGGYISIGRVRTPVLAMIARREKEILEFKPQNYFEIDADVLSGSGSKATLTCASMPKGFAGVSDDDEPEEEDESDAAQIVGESGSGLDGKIARREIAEAIAASMKGTTAPIAVKSGKKRTAPPKLFDTASITAAGNLRLGMSPQMVADVCQSLYDKEIITYPRGESCQMPETSIQEAYPLIEMLTGIAQYGEYAGILREPIVRKGKSGVYWNGIAEKYSHFAIVPNFAACDRIPGLIRDLTTPEARMFDMIARRFLAAHAPDYVYDQTVLSLVHKWGPPGKGPYDWRFSRTGNVPVEAGWKDIEHPNGSWRKNDKDPTLDPFSNGEQVETTDVRVQTKTTKPPSRFRIGAIPTLMAQIWRTLPKEQAQYREKLKEIEGIGRPGTRGAIAPELIRVGQVIEDKDFLRPTKAGMAIWETLSEISPNVVDPVRTAVWETLFTKVRNREMTLNEVILKVVDSTEAERKKIIGAGKTVSIDVGSARKPDARILDWAKRLAAGKGIPLPKEVAASAQACSRFIDEHRPRDAEGNALKGGSMPPSEKQISLARELADSTGMKITAEHLANSESISKFIDAARTAAPPSEKQIAMAERLAQENGIELPDEARKGRAACSNFIDKHMKGGKKGTGKPVSKARNYRPPQRRQSK